MVSRKDAKITAGRKGRWNSSLLPLRLCVKPGFQLLVIGAFLFTLIMPTHARADLSQKQARKVIQTIGGWSLPSEDVRVRSVQSSSPESAEVSAEIEAVFRMRLHEGQWQLREIRIAPDRWERLELIARAANTEVPPGNCGAPSQFTRSKSATELTNKRARCLVAALLGVSLPSDEVRIKEISQLGLSIGSESAALVTALVQADFRLARDARGWRVAEFKSGGRDWARVADLPAALDEVKTAVARNDILTLEEALKHYQRERGVFVVSGSESVLIDHLSPHYLTRVIRFDPWHRPYQYKGEIHYYTILSMGPDGKPHTPDDVAVSGPQHSGGSVRFNP